MDTSWIPVTSPKEIRSSRDVNKLEVNLGTASNDTLPFLSLGTEDRAEEPVEVIIFRVIFALLISVSLVVNLLLVLAILRIRCRVSVVYILLAALLLPGIVFYVKLVTELIHWDAADPGWAAADWSCGLWQFATHVYPLAYSVTLVAVLHHATVTLYMDYKGDYERAVRRLLPLLLLALGFLLAVVCAASGFYSRAKTQGSASSDRRQYCDLAVPGLGPQSGTAASSGEAAAAVAAYRLVYEVVLPYMVPLLLVAFPYVSLLVGE